MAQFKHNRIIRQSYLPDYHPGGGIQFVAETFIIEAKEGKTYFCKVITKPLFIPHVTESLPVLDRLRGSGFTRAAFPIRTVKKELYVLVENTLIMLFEYIDAPQKYEFDMQAFGKLIAELHNVKLETDLAIPAEIFSFKYPGRLEQELTGITENEAKDAIDAELQKLIREYAQEMRSDYQAFRELSARLAAQEHQMVITHGDPGGNTLVKSPSDLYLIDWDDILLSPPERDTWFFQDKPEFIQGYRTVFTDYQVNLDLSRYFLYKRYFEDLIEYFAEIRGNFSDEIRREGIKNLREDCLEGWLRPQIRKFEG